MANTHWVIQVYVLVSNIPAHSKETIITYISFSITVNLRLESRDIIQILLEPATAQCVLLILQYN